MLHHRGPTFTTPFPRVTALPSRPDRAATPAEIEPEKDVENPLRKTYLIRADAIERRKVDDLPLRSGGCFLKILNGERSD